jgi:hypothetical protein
MNLDLGNLGDSYRGYEDGTYYIGMVINPIPYDPYGGGETPELVDYLKC